MALSRHELRYKVMTILYQVNLYDNNNIEYNIDDIINNQLEEKSKFVNNLVKGILEKKTELDNLANKYLENWEMNRLGFTDQAIVRIAIYELLYTDTPNVTCIDEAIELAKEYSDDKVCKMINGVLDKIYHNENCQ